MINLMLRTSATEIYNFEGVNNSITKLKIANIQPYNTISDIFDFQVGDLVIVLWAASGTDPRNIPLISSASKILVRESTVNIQRVFIFTEDLYVLRKGTAEEIIFIKKLLQYIDCNNYRIFHCEQNVTQLNTLGLKIEYFDWFVTSCIQDYRKTFGIEELEYNFKKKICCLNRRFDEHRYLACAVLSNYRDAYYTQQYSLADTEMFRLKVDALSDPIQTKVLDGFKNLKKASRIVDRSIPVETIDKFEYSSVYAMHDLNSKTKYAFCSLVTESRFYSDFPNFSEKTLRAIYCGRPFLLLAPPGTLKLLQELGIKTFSDFWDESYDDIQDHTLRFQRVMEIATDILSRTNLSIESLRPILEYNMHQLDNVPKRMLQLNL
jgi:hypothetical protein